MKSLILITLSVLVLAACSPAPDTGKPQVALIMKSLANEFFATMAKGAEAHHAAHAADYDLLVNGIKTKPI